jgi:hypothetical protein
LGDLGESQVAWGVICGLSGSQVAWGSGVDLGVTNGFVGLEMASGLRVASWSCGWPFGVAEDFWELQLSSGVTNIACKILTNAQNFRIKNKKNQPSCFLCLMLAEIMGFPKYQALFDAKTFFEPDWK